MKKSFLLIALLTLLLLFTACEKQVAPTPEPEIQTPDVQPEPEPVDPAPVKPEPTLPTPTIPEPDPPTLEALRNEAADGGCVAAVAFLGCTEAASPEAVLSCIDAGGQWEQYAFLCSIPAERFVFLGGSEIYCIVPASKDAKVTVNSLSYDAEGKAVTGDALYEGDAHPVIIVANASDIMPNSLVTIDAGEPAVFSPYISLKDGSLAFAGTEAKLHTFGTLTPPPEVEPEEPAEPEELEEPKAEPNGNVIYLTFDDGPSKYTEELLDVLDRYNVKATFFTVNMGHTDMIGEEYRRGHTVGIHSASHEYDSIYASEDAYFEDLQKMSDIVYEQTGTHPTLIRFPGGSSNKVSLFNPGIMTRLVDAVQEKGYQYFDWNVSSGDAGETTDTATVAENVIEGCTNRTASVVLQHDSKGYSVAAVEQIIRWGLENGYTFEPLTMDSPSAHHHLNN